MRDSYQASLLLSLELFCVFMALNATLLAMEEENPPSQALNKVSQCRAKIFYEKQRSECRNSLLISIEQFLLVLPSELGCGPCRFGHWVLGTNRFYHVESRKKQLTSLKGQLEQNGFCSLDISKYINEVMGEFYGEYGQNFKKMCLTMLGNVQDYFKEYYSTLESEGFSEGFIPLCALCGNAQAQVQYSCSHVSTCAQCEEKRLYHLCLICEPENQIQAMQFVPDACVICFDAPRDSVTLPCGHAHFCFNCASRGTQCPFCKSTIAQLIKIDAKNRQMLCGICSSSVADIINLSCEHISICQSCLKLHAEYTCSICQKLCSSSNTSKLFQ